MTFSRPLTVIHKLEAFSAKREGKMRGVIRTGREDEGKRYCRRRG